MLVKKYLERYEGNHSPGATKFAPTLRMGGSYRAVSVWVVQVGELKPSFTIIHSKDLTCGEIYFTEHVLLER